MPESFRSVELLRVEGAKWSRSRDLAAVEEPLQVTLGGEPFAVIMRTPGADIDLVAGFLLSERVVTDASDIGTMEHCGRSDSSEAQNLVDVRLTDRAARRLPVLLADRRQVMTGSACGLCGRRTIDSLKSELAPLSTGRTVTSESLGEMPVQMRQSQAVFHETGGLHAAGLFDVNGGLERLAEDVGRHNAVDKVVGRMLIDNRLPLSNAVLFVSGRSSFEIVQKAFVAGISIVASVSAPSSLAVDLAREAGITLVGFVRDDRFNVYTHAHRIGGSRS